MAPGTVSTIDHDHVGVTILDKGVDKPHSESSCTDDEVIGLHLRPPVLAPECRPPEVANC